MQRVIARFLLLLVAAAAAKDKPRDWKSGVLLEVAREKGSRVVGHMSGSDGNVNGHLVQKRDDATYYTIETGDLIYVAKRTLTSRGDKQLKLTVNAPIKFAISGDDFFVLDEDGKEHKLTLEEKRAKQPPPPPKS